MLNSLEKYYNIQIKTAKGTIITETIKAINELEAIDIMYAKHKKKNIIDIKAV